MTDNKYFIFGKSLASVQLAQALMVAPSLMRKKISTHITEFCEGLRQLEPMQDDTCRVRMASLWMQHHIDHELIIRNAPDFNYDTTMKNVIKYRYRLWLEEHGNMRKTELINRKTKNIRESAKAKAWIAVNLP